ncbi:MAG: hypothetical protein U0840_24570 [Gemmataceae bacterium]
MRAIAALFLCTLVAPAALAHPVPRENHDRTLVVYLTPTAMVVDYRVELDDYRLYRDLDGVDLKRAPGESVHAAYLRYFATVLKENLVATLDGRELEFTCLGSSFRVLDHVRCDYRFRAEWKLQAGQEYRVTFADANFHGDEVSRLHLTLDPSPELTLSAVEAPDDALLTRPPALLEPGERERRSKLSARVRVEPSFHAGLARPALPPDPEPLRPGAVGKAARQAVSIKPIPTENPGQVRADPPSSVETASSPRWLDVLFDTRRGLGVLLLLFAGFGAGHALTPGHGKTLVAAYLIGERGTYAHALMLGVVTTLTHTAVVMAIALALPWIFPNAPPAAIQAVLGLVGGLLIAGVGAWLLLQRLAGRPDHVHLGGSSHSHSHAGDESDPAPPVSPGWWGVIALGISGGIVPCWDAMLIPAVCLSANRPELAWPLVLAFSAGLAGVLVLLGIVVVRARLAAGDLVESRRMQWITRALPLLSAGVIVVLGLMMCFESVRGVR